MARTSAGFNARKTSLEMQAQKGTRKDRPARLRLSQIKTEPAVFQPRTGRDNEGVAEQDHVKELVHQLGTLPEDRRALDPIKVVAIGNKFYVINGHHRRAAYKAHGGIEDVPVEHFEGNIDEAIQEGGRINSKAHLNLGRDDRNEIAWWMTCIGEEKKPRTTIQEIVEASRLSTRSVEKMRALYKRLQNEHATTCPLSGERIPAEFDTYKEAVEEDRGGKPEFTEDMREAMIEDMRSKLGKALGKHPHSRPDVMGEALERYLGESTFKKMTEHMGYRKMTEGEIEGEDGDL